LNYFLLLDLMTRLRKDMADSKGDLGAVLDNLKDVRSLQVRPASALYKLLLLKGLAMLVDVH
jgi:phosphatidylserine synthase